jgi:hypothetical protein
MESWWWKLQKVPTKQEAAAGSINNWIEQCGSAGRFCQCQFEGRIAASVRKREGRIYCGLRRDGNTEFAKMLTLVNTDKVWAEPARFTARAFVAKGALLTYIFSRTSLPPCKSA